MRQGLIEATIPLSGSVSGDIDLRGGRLSSIFVPVITAGNVMLQGSYNTTSANFVRVQAPVFGDVNVNSGDLRLVTGTGSKMVIGLERFSWPAYVRLETAVAQEAARTFTIRFGS